MRSIRWAHCDGRKQGVQAGGLRYSRLEACATTKRTCARQSEAGRSRLHKYRDPRFTSIRLWQLVAVVCMTALITGCLSTKGPAVAIQSRKPITISYSDTAGILRYETHPVLRGSINGVSGNFVIDTGATIPILGIAAARQCRFEPFWPPASERTNRFWGEKIRMMKATNIVAEFAPGFSVHWPEVLVSGEEEFFGIIDYRTLKEANAIIDTKNKTITVTK